MVHCDAPTIRADVELSTPVAAATKQRAAKKQTKKKADRFESPAPTNSKLRERDGTAFESPAKSEIRDREREATTLESPAKTEFRESNTAITVPIPAPRKFIKHREGRSSAGDVPDDHLLQDLTIEFEVDGNGRKASITTVIDAEELKRKKEKAAVATPKRLSLIDVKEEAEAVAAAVRMRRRSRQLRSQQPVKEDVRGAERIASPKATPAKDSKVIRFQEDQEVEQQRRQEQQQQQQQQQIQQHHQQQLHHLNVEQQKQQEHQEEPEQLEHQERHHPHSNVLEEQQIQQHQDQVQQQHQLHEERETQQPEPMSLKESSREEEDEDVHDQSPRPLFKRQNSYRAAQETNPIADQGSPHRFIIHCHSAPVVMNNLSCKFVHPWNVSSHNIFSGI